MKLISERLKAAGKLALLPFAAFTCLLIALVMRFGGKPSRY